VSTSLRTVADNCRDDQFGWAAFLELDLKEVADFVVGTFDLVPQDEEFRQPDLDAELGWLIAWVFTGRERRILDRP
jgi:hypothetical protein